MNNAFRKEPDAEKPHVRNSVRDTFGNGCIYSTRSGISELEVYYLAADYGKSLYSCAPLGKFYAGGF